MATKLKNLRISKVDFVDEGANPDAHIKLTKSKGERGSPQERMAIRMVLSADCSVSSAKRPA